MESKRPGWKLTLTALILLLTSCAKAVPPAETADYFPAQSALIIDTRKTVLDGSGRGTSTPLSTVSGAKQRCTDFVQAKTLAAQFSGVQEIVPSPGKMVVFCAYSTKHVAEPETYSVAEVEAATVTNWAVLAGKDTDPRCQKNADESVVVLLELAPNTWRRAAPIKCSAK